MKNGIFAKLSAIAVTVLTLAAIFSSCAVSTPEEIIGTVSLPDTYSIVYEVEEKNGVITTVGKTVDKNGNVYFQSGETELIFIKDGSNYIEYTRSSDGEFVSELGKKVDSAYVSDATAEFHGYVEQSMKKNIPTVEKMGESNILGRACEVYNVKVGIKSFNVSYTYFVDSETGVCLEYSAEMTLAGISTNTDETTFTCVEFITESVEPINK